MYVHASKYTLSLGTIKHAHEKRTCHNCGPFFPPLDVTKNTTAAFFFANVMRRQS